VDLLLRQPGAVGRRCSHIFFGDRRVMADDLGSRQTRCESIQYDGDEDPRALDAWLPVAHRWVDRDALEKLLRGHATSVPALCSG